MKRFILVVFQIIKYQQCSLKKFNQFEITVTEHLFPSSKLISCKYNTIPRESYTLRFRLMSDVDINALYTFLL